MSITETQKKNIKKAINYLKNPSIRIGKDDYFYDKEETKPCCTMGWLSRKFQTSVDGLVYNELFGDKFKVHEVITINDKADRPSRRKEKVIKYLQGLAE